MISLKKNFKKLVFIFLSIYFFYGLTIYVRFFFAVYNTNEKQNQDFLILKIYGNSSSKDGNTVSARFSILDSNQNTITELERSWSGNYLAVNFARINLFGKEFIFPTEIFAKEKIFENSKNGIKLEKYYDENKQCILFSQNYSLKSRKRLYLISRFVNKKYLVPTFNFIKNSTINLSECKNDVFYIISCDKSGNLILHQM